MSKLLKALIGILLIVCVIALLVSLIAPLVFDEILGALGDWLDTAPTETTLAVGDIYEIPVRIFRQNAEDGSYALQGESTEYLRVGESKTYSFSEQELYDIDTEKSKLFVDEPGDVIEVYYALETCTVYFDMGLATIVDGYALQTVRKGQTPIPPTVSLKGYTCTGYDRDIAPVYKDTVFTASFEKTKYSLYLYVTDETVMPDGFQKNDTADGCFEAKYTFEDSIVLPTPQSDGYTFLEWNTSPDGKGETVTAIVSGTYENTSLYAIYTVKLYSISFESPDGVSYPSYYLPYNTPISSPSVAPEHQKAGYGLSWYTDADCTELYDFRVMPKENLVLYGKWEKDTGTGFLEWTKETLLTNTIDSREELAAFIDYVRFHNLTEGLTVGITYVDQYQIESEVSAAQSLGEFRASGSIAYTVSAGGSMGAGVKCRISLRVSNEYRDTEATKTTDPTDIKAYTYLTAAVTPRGEGYRDFYIDGLVKSYAVTTSNQLLYVVEHGYRPIPAENSPAERVYLAARQLLNEILPENATQLEKAELIYTYLVTNIVYDENAVSIAKVDGNRWPEYDAFYMEGVFFEKKAVCDGISSAFSLLCNIEGIPAVKVLGPGHAWNRVKINNRWYVADATFGNVHLTGMNYSVADHAQFLISDAKKTEQGYAPQNYFGVVADRDYGYYRYKTVTYKGRSFDYEINSVEELARLLEYTVSLRDELENTTVNFVYAVSGISFKDAVTAARDILRVRGVVIRNGISYYGGSSTSSYKLIFTS